MAKKGIDWGAEDESTGFGDFSAEDDKGMDSALKKASGDDEDTEEEGGTEADIRATVKKIISGELDEDAAVDELMNLCGMSR